MHSFWQGKRLHGNWDKYPRERVSVNYKRILIVEVLVSTKYKCHQKHTAYAYIEPSWLKALQGIGWLHLDIA